MKEVFDRIVDELSGKLYGYLLKLVRSKEDAEDILQDVFSSFWDKMPSINPESYTSYLYRAAHNKAINRLKKEKRYVSFNEFTHSAPVESVDDAFVERKNRIIREAMRTLKQKKMLALELQFYQKKSYKEIAEIMNITPNAVDSLLFRAKKKLRQILQDKEV